MLEVEMDEHLGYEKNSVSGNNCGNSRNGYGRKTIISDYGDCEIAVPRDRNGEFEPQVIGKRQTRTDEIEQKIMAIFPTDDSIRKVIYLSASEISKKWTQSVRDWGLAYAQFAVFFEDRFAA